MLDGVCFPKRVEMVIHRIQEQRKPEGSIPSTAQCTSMPAHLDSLECTEVSYSAPMNDRGGSGHENQQANFKCSAALRHTMLDCANALGF